MMVVTKLLGYENWFLTNNKVLEKESYMQFPHKYKWSTYTPKYMDLKDKTMVMQTFLSPQILVLKG